MQLALPADSPARDYSPSRTTPTSRTKMMVASVAMASAGALVVTPVTPALPELIEQRAVELAAFTNPLVTLQQTIANTFNNLGALTTASAGVTGNAAAALTNPAVYAQIANFIAANATNPGPLLAQLANFNTNFGSIIGNATAGSNAALQDSLELLPATLTNAFNFLRTGQFVEAFSELNIYFLVRLIERPGNPLVPIFSIPGDIAAALPGGQIVANVLDSLLTRGVFSGLTRALFVAPITATLQVAEILDAVRASVVVGDFGTALSELINMPIKVANAFVNGYVPNFPTRSLFQGLLSPNGPLDYFLNDLPNAIFTALNASVAPPAAPTVTTAALTTTSPTDIPAASASLISVEAPAADASETAPVVSETTETETGATAPVVETPAVETSAAEPVAVETPAVETPATETPVDETPAVTPVSDETETESGSNKPTSTWGGDKSDIKATDSGTGTGTSGSTGGSTAGGTASGGNAASGSDATAGDASGSGSDSTSSDSDKSGGSDSDSSGGDE
ncbi:hypothetical protein [Mycolicibacterium lacusdiani]|uniref:hypothetical protein n=1 Tax=Mycolicibacterium lacusdiani TaxID=2895283 RepID=UPI001F3F284F|nr:hypothetical protein [Mycolicibacterium lacusdiani]